MVAGAIKKMKRSIHSGFDRVRSNATNDLWDFGQVLSSEEKVLWQGKGSGKNYSAEVWVGPSILIFLFLLLFAIGAWNDHPVGASLPFLIAYAAITVMTCVYSSLRFFSPATEDYCITNKRVMIRPLLLGGSIRSFVPENSKFELSQVREFQRVVLLPRRRSVLFKPHFFIRGSRNIIPIFCGLDDAERVQRIAQEAFNLK